MWLITTVAAIFVYILHFVYSCVYDAGTRQAHSTSTIRPLMWRRLGDNLPARWLSQAVTFCYILVRCDD